MQVGEIVRFVNAPKVVTDAFGESAVVSGVSSKGAARATKESLRAIAYSWKLAEARFRKRREESRKACDCEIGGVFIRNLAQGSLVDVSGRKARVVWVDYVKLTAGLIWVKPDVFVSE